MHPIISALKHHKTTVLLVALEIAVTCAIVTNAVFIIGDHLTVMNLKTGVVNNELVWARNNTLDLGQNTAPGSQANQVAADLTALRAMPGVKSVAMTNSLPLSNGYFSIAVFRTPGDTKSAINNIVEYLGTPDLVKTLGIKLDEGRDFLPQEYVDYNPFKRNTPPSVVIITHKLAEQLWPGQDPLGKPVFLDDEGKQVVRVVGVVHLLNPVINKNQGIERSMLLPVKSVDGGMYVLRVAPDMRDATVRDLPKVLKRLDNARITDAQSYADTVSDYFHNDRAMIWLLLVVITCLLGITAVSVVGLSSFWVQQRTRSVGIRRAIGATRGNILVYFQIENFLIVTVGVIAGLILAVGLNLVLMKHYELSRLPFWYLPIGAVLLWLIGQLSVLGPAMRAARIPPAAATRNLG